MSDTNRVGIKAVVESTFGEVPASPVLRDLCITGLSGLAFTPETTVSEKIRSDRQIDDLVLVGGEAAGDIGSELAFSIQDFLLEGAFFNAFQARAFRLNDEENTHITAATAGVDFTVVDNSSGVPAVNDIFRGEGFAVAGNNAFHIDGGASTATSWDTSTAATEAAPPNQARLKIVGHRSDGAGDLVLAISGSTGTLTSTLTDLSAATLGLQAGDWVCLDGFPVQPTSEGFYRLSLDPTATLMTFDIVPAGAVTDTPAGLADIYVGERLINGITQQSYTFEESFNDHALVTYQYFRGMTVDGMVLTAPSQSIVTISYTFSGRDAFFSDSGEPATVPDQLPGVTAGRVTTPIDVTSLPVNILNSSSDVARIAQNGVPISGANFVLELTLEIANNLRQRNAVGFLGAVSIGSGEFGVTGTLNTYFDNSTLARQVISNAATSYDTRFVDSESHAIVIDAPRIKFSEGAPEVASKNEDVVANLGYQAIRHPVFGYTLLWQRFTGFVKSN